MEIKGNRGHITRAVQGARVWRKWLQNRCPLGRPVSGEAINNGNIILIVFGPTCELLGYSPPIILGLPEVKMEQKKAYIPCAV